jgi:hypothetical protein
LWALAWAKNSSLFFFNIPIKIFLSIEKNKVLFSSVGKPRTAGAWESVGGGTQINLRSKPIKKNYSKCRILNFKLFGFIQNL